MSRSDSIGQRTRQNGVGSHIDAVSLEILALTSITERGYWGIELGGHTHQSMGDFLGNLNSNASRYWDLSANFDLGKGYALTPHIGRQTVPNQTSTTVTGNAADYTDYSLALAKDFGNGLVLSATAITTNADQTFYTDSKGKFLGRSVTTVGLKYTF